ncbi:MAG: hypothetical protein ACI8RZ_004193 [Myxococcota bacterium]|jgi:hypothetical protein
MLFLLACAPEFVPQSLSGAGYEEVVFDTLAASVDPDEVLSATVAGLPAYDLRTTGGGRLAMTIQGGAAGVYDVEVQTKTATVTVGAIEYQPPADPIFERTVAIGASITMGFQDAATGARAQLASPPAILAQTVGAWMPLPLLKDDLWQPVQLSDMGEAPGCEIPALGAVVLASFLDALASMLDPETGEYDFRLARKTPDVVPHNVAIGGYLLNTILEGAPANDPIYSILTYLTLQNDRTRLGDDTGLSALERLEALEPTLIISTDLYGNDILSAATSSGGIDWDQVTPPEEIRADLALIVERLSATGAEVFLGNLPRLDRLPSAIQQQHDPTEMTALLEVLDEYNGALAEEAARWPNVHVVDQYQYVEDNLDGLTTDDFSLTMGPLGGLVSYDGVHFSDTGNALVAELFIEHIEEELGMTLPEVDLVNTLLGDPHSPLVLDVYGRSESDCD